MSNIKARLEQRFVDIAKTGNLFKCVILLGTYPYSERYPDIARVDTIKKNNRLLFNERILDTHLEYFVSRTSCQRDIYDIFSEACRAEKIDNDSCTKYFDRDAINNIYEKHLPYIKNSIRDDFSKIFDQFREEQFKQ